MRLTMIRLADDTHEFIWSHHHLLIDGWTSPLLGHEVFAYYEAYRRGEKIELLRPRRYRDYISWLRQQDLAQAEVFWRRLLAGFDAPTPLPPRQPSTQAPATASSSAPCRRQRRQHCNTLPAGIS